MKIDLSNFAPGPSFDQSAAYTNLGGKGRSNMRKGIILAGGPVAGRVALRFIAEVESAQQIDQIVTSIPLWTISDTRVTPLIEFGDRRAHVEILLQRYKAQ